MPVFFLNRFSDVLGSRPGLPRPDTVLATGACMTKHTQFDSPRVCVCPVEEPIGIGSILMFAFYIQA